MSPAPVERLSSLNSSLALSHRNYIAIVDRIVAGSGPLALNPPESSGLTMAFVCTFLSLGLITPCLPRDEALALHSSLELRVPAHTERWFGRAYLVRSGLSSSVGLNAVPSRSVQFTSAKLGWIRQIAARVGRSAPGGDRAPGQPPQPGSPCPCPPPRPPERALQRRTRPLGQERGQCPRLGSSAGRQRAVPSGQEKSSNSSHLCPQLWCWSSQRQEASAAGLCAGGLWSCPRCGAVLAGAAWSLPCPSPETQREPCAQGPWAPCQERGSSPGSRLEEQTSQQSQIAVEARAVFGAGSAESCVCLCCPSLSTGTGNSLGKGIGAVADAQGEEHKPTAIQPDSPLHPELSTHPHREAQQLKEKKPTEEKAASREGRRGSLWDETAESEQRSSLGLEKGQGTNTVAPGHL
ncbi:uncharacterized protein LOC129046665 [Molothrus ater]|uniref:uncharacterized protein LOC129046665 n=1 Tax=Molothrus ater TaxID=84834 RepID=UPI0023E88F6C|nr:uncharacterized protein LOC129046665 [Molothrus ater]